MSLASIRTGDLVTIIAGRNRGKTGTIEKLLPSRHRALVAGINIVKKHAKASGKYPTGGIVTKSLPIDISNVMILCPHCQKPSRVGRLTSKDKSNRVCKRCRQIIQTKSSHE